MLFYKTDGIVEWQMLERNEIGSHTDSVCLRSKSDSWAE